MKALSNHPSNTNKSSDESVRASKAQSPALSDSDQDSTEYVPNSHPLPLITSGPLNFSPCYYEAEIISCENMNDGPCFYNVSLVTKDGGKAEFKRVAPEDILNYVSTLSLEKFEARRAQDEAQKRNETARMHQPTRRLPGSKDAISAMGILGKNLSIDETDNIIMLPRIEASSRGSASDSSLNRNRDDERPRQRRKRPRLLQLEETEYDVEAILDDRIVSKSNSSKSTEFEYLVKWVGWSDRFNTWEPVRHLAGAERLLTEYWDTKMKNGKIITKITTICH